MGFDICGLNAASKKGEYFRNNVWWWRPLADFVVGACQLEPDGWFHNGGHEISAAEAEQIAHKLDELLASGEVKSYETWYLKELANLPDLQCDFCRGTGVRSDPAVQGTCNACRGEGTVVAFARHYPFSEENVREFAEFCRDSGGFTIC